MDKIIAQDMQETIEQSFMDYALEVLTSRAIPDICGNKPVHTRILYALSQLGLTPNKPHKKSARVVGETIGRFHAHGDSSVYSAMVRMSQDWVMRYPLIDFQGNKGSIDGDVPAHMRYTEARLSPLGQLCLSNLSKDVIPFQPNFSEDDIEPTILPVPFPNLLVNPTSGIAVGITSSFVSHNMTEALEACIKTLDNKDITIEQLHSVVLGPDFPTGGEIINQNELINIYKTGTGKVKVRGRYNIISRNKKTIIAFYEIPFGVKKEGLVEEIVQRCLEKKIEGIANIEDLSNKEGILIEIEVKKGFDPEKIINDIFYYTHMQETILVNQICLVEDKPTQVNLKDIIVNFLEMQKSIAISIHSKKLQETKDKIHIYEGFVKIIDSIPKIIDIITCSNSVDEAVKSLQLEYFLSSEQSKAIIDMKLRSLTKLETNGLQTTLNDLYIQLEHLDNILNSEMGLNEYIKSQLLEIKNKFGDSRRTVISNISEAKKPPKKKQEKVIEEVVVIVSDNFEVNRVAKKSFKGVPLNHQDYHLTTEDYLLVFTNKGKMYRVPVSNIKNQVSLRLLAKMEIGENPVYVTHQYREGDIVFITKQGMIKKSNMKLYTDMKRTGNALGLKEEDEVVYAKVLENKETTIITQQNIYIKIDASLVNSTGKTSKGVIAIKLNEGDYVIKASDSINNLPCQNKGGKGRRIIDKI